MYFSRLIHHQAVIANNRTSYYNSRRGLPPENLSPYFGSKDGAHSFYLDYNTTFKSYIIMYKLDFSGLINRENKVILKYVEAWISIIKAKVVTELNVKVA